MFICIPTSPLAILSNSASLGIAASIASNPNAIAISSPFLLNLADILSKRPGLSLLTFSISSAVCLFSPSIFLSTLSALSLAISFAFSRNSFIESLFKISGLTFPYSNTLFEIS